MRHALALATLIALPAAAQVDLEGPGGGWRTLLPAECDSRRPVQQLDRIANIVWVPDGWARHEMARFEAAVIEMMDSIHQRHRAFPRELMNVMWLRESVDTGCYATTTRVFCPTAPPQPMVVASGRCTDDPQRVTVVLLNADTYGGTAWPYIATAAVTTYGVGREGPGEIVAHELGHALLWLGDEYPGGGLWALPNCSAPGCAAWQDIMGWQGVSCVTGCGGDDRWTSERTLMRQLGTQLHEVNDRFACCEWQRITGGRMPAYCASMPGLIATCLSKSLQPRTREQYAEWAEPDGRLRRAEVRERE